MKKVLYFVFLAFTLVPKGHQVVHKRGNTFPFAKKVPKVTESTDTALSNLMTKAVPFPYNNEHSFRLISQACRNDMSLQCKQKTGKEMAIHYDFSQKTCYVMGTPGYDVYVLSKTKSGTSYPETVDLPPGSEELASRLEYQAVWLPFAENKDTYTILDPERACWFFTAELGGCDMFVATEENQGNMPLVVHSNRNIELDPEKNQELKEKSVDLLINSVNDAYKVIARVYWTSTKPAEKENINQHLLKYAETHKGITFMHYDTSFEKFHFFGHYYGSSWKFVLKGIDTGKIISKFSVSKLGTVVEAQQF